MNGILVLIVTIAGSLAPTLSEAQTASGDNRPFQAITFRPIPRGPAVWGIFVGRTPCSAIASQFKLDTAVDCGILKFGLILYRDTLTFEPDSCALTIIGAGDIVQAEGGSYREKVLRGKWSITKGTDLVPDEQVYKLALGEPEIYFYLLKGDDNVLFILDENKEPRVGNEYLSYTLNRVQLVPGKK
jgi:hypothetical protein